MKIKNMKLMLLGLLAMGSMNAFAAIDEESRSVNDVLYLLETNGNNKTATVVGINSLASEANQKTISIPATVAGEHGTYKVVALKSGWEKAIKDVSAVTTSLSIDVTNFTGALEAATAFNSFTKLEALTITDSNAAKDAKTLKFDGSAANCKSTLKSLTISGSNINEIAANGVQKYTALETVELGQVKTIGDEAFEGCSKVSSLTIPATVTTIGKDAFANMYKAKDGDKPATGLQTLTFNANDAITKIPAAFTGDKLLKEVTITSAKATSIEANAFTDDNAIEKIDLSGMTALATAPTDAFDADLKLKSLKLYGTKLTEVAPTIAESGRTLEEITLPADLAAANLPSFSDFVALKSIDFSNTKNITAIPDNEFDITGSVVDDKGKPIAPALASVTLNAKTASIGASAFSGQTALATIANLNQANLTSIGASAFRKTALTAVDLSAATNKGFTTIYAFTFAEMPNLATVTLPAQIDYIEDWAFYHSKAITSINLEATKITYLGQLFTDAWDAMGTGTVEDDDIAYAPAGLTTLTLPETLEYIDYFALQGLGIKSITIPSSVSYMGNFALQGCLDLEEFTWVETYANGLGLYTFRGDVNLKKVVFYSLGGINTWKGKTDTYNDGLTDNHFFMCNDVQVYVSAEDYNALVGRGYTPENSKYSTLNGDQKMEYAFSPKGKASDGFYYGTFHATQGCWFPADEFEVFTAVVEGDKVNLKAAEVIDGYYKLPTYSNVVLRSTNDKGSYETKALANNASKNNSIEKLQNHLSYCYSDGDVKGSKINYIYKLGVKNDIVAFYRITSGEFKKGQMFINAEWSKKDRLDIMIDGVDIDVDATAIFGIESANEKANAPIYNLQGVRVQKAQKGVYIQNGKKYMMK